MAPLFSQFPGGDIGNSIQIEGKQSDCVSESLTRVAIRFGDVSHYDRREKKDGAKRTTERATLISIREAISRMPMGSPSMSELE